MFRPSAGSIAIPGLASASVLVATLTTAFAFAQAPLSHGGVVPAGPPATAPSDAGPVSTTPGGGQKTLTVGSDAAGQLRARVCAEAPCSVEGGAVIALPVEATRLLSAAHFRVVAAGLGRQAVVVEIADPKSGRSWAALIAAPLAGEAPVVPFAAETGFLEGVEGERSGPSLLVRTEGVYVGILREGRDLCGRPALLSARVLDPATLTLKAAKLQRLSAAERDAAPHLSAQPTTDQVPSGLLGAQWATSAAPNAPPSAVADGKDDTVWAENRGGSGRGEFVVLRAPRAVPLASFVFALPTPKNETAVPRELYLATDDSLFRVTISDDAGRTHGAPAKDSVSRYEVSLPAPVRTSCVALVLERGSSEDRSAEVSIAEVGAKAAISGGTEELVQLLAKGGPDAEAAAAMLRARGGEGFSALATAFASLDEDARRVALDVLDDATCDVALPPYIDALVGASEANKLHARSAISRCASSAGPAFAKALSTAPVAQRGPIADELAEFAPPLAVETLVPLLGGAGRAERRGYRDAIGRAAELPTSENAVAAALSNRALPAAAVVELLRALGPRVAAYGNAAIGAFGAVAGAGDKLPFRTRYLLLSPAEELAAVDEGARGFVRRAIATDSRPEIRAQAARLVRVAPPFASELSKAAQDPDVRVREAAVLSLGNGQVEAARDIIVQRLREDSWPLVRAASARALSGLSSSTPTDDALVGALADGSPDVRRSALTSLGAHGVRGAGASVEARLNDKEEFLAVRATAATVLGAICDAAAADSLTEHARRLVDAGADDSERIIARSALSGLALLKPADLASRLAPLRDAKAPAVVRKAASDALSTPGRCAVSSPPLRGPARLPQPVQQK